LKEYPLKNIMEDITGLNGSVITDAQAAAWAEYTVLPKEICDMVFITVSTGVGGGIVVNRKLLTGVSGLAGHVGHILSGVTDTECGCGRRGCVEAVSSGRAIMGAAKNKLAGYSTKYIFELARQGYKEAEFLTERSASTIAELIVSLKLLLDCQVVVVGGSVGLADGYVQKVSKHLSIYSEICNVMLFPAYFRSDSGLIGATLWDRDCIT
ncbi:N-acetylmannosamine kinase, partial [Escherichia coli]